MSSRFQSTKGSVGQKPTSSGPANVNNTLHDRKHQNGNGAHEHEKPREPDEPHFHSIFGHSHSHGDENGHTHDAEQIIAALKGSRTYDKGSQVTLIGLFSNIVLTTAKGLAGWYMHSASLLADAGHSMSDLLGDFVTLFCWRLSRKPPSERYPYGFAKFETLGTTTISILLIAGAVTIGLHSYNLLIATLAETTASLSPGQLQDFLRTITTAVPLPDIGHHHVHLVDPNAAWFAAVSVVAKEWLYRITKVVADEESSPVLLANAIHHRSDAYSSLVAFFAIIGTWLWPAFPLDPIGGLLVSMVILKQGFDLLRGAWGDLTDAGVSPRKRKLLLKTLQPFIPDSWESSSCPTLISFDHLRARRAGSLMFVDVTAKVSDDMTVIQASAWEDEITRTLKAAHKEITEVRVKFEVGQIVVDI
ncbi:CDF-like metal transporter [Laccaria bicolor S238N-H82]|uniref:CDF-like metal transporter n=1 Tax=Laccaria bicolor (strain S238N-H82 / ATCC MYA-4686) TaxID=486041 RepID=B0D880_LACBS|nr:CDF-like metal transporter [Laccaria bicolor S238N-H82]EDR08788.1 CDF-like metal transporter [Laccaria bicolor S238N-H82]|eukprot:XP_001880101.1 CDF-like metal transporter [Laccaria bicolor S238N-H82]